jgi:hypothetical protein
MLTVDWEQVRFKRAISGFLAMLIALVFAATVDEAVLSATMATLFVLASGGGGPMSERLPMMAQVTGIGAVLGGLAFWSAETAPAVALVLGVATYVGTLAAAIDRRAARAGLFLTLWALMALLLGSADTEPWRASLGFVAGGLIAIAVTAVRLRTIGGDTVQLDDENGEDAASASRVDRIRAAASSPIGQFALARAIAVVAAVLLGYWWFSAHSMWVAITVIVILQPSAHQSVSVGVQRTIGTALGVAVAVLVAEILPRVDTAVVIAFLVSGLLMVAFMNANYVLFAAFLTAMLVFGQRLAEADAFQAGWERLLATALGAIISFAVTLLVSRSTPARSDCPATE